ncbi:MAG: RluA family pseudouridine synthase [Methylotenera sp.]|nr:RluA family pseudouridine synthase [Oligoflexia bacterium]
MAIKKFLLKTTIEHKGKRLDQVLSEWLPIALAQPVSKAKARKLVVAGGIYLNGKRVRIASKELQVNARVEAFVDLAKLNSDGPQTDILFNMQESDVLFEDQYIIAVNKPAGLPTQPTVDEARANLFAAVKKFLTGRTPGMGPAYVGLHHRLDRDTSGVVLFTKSTEANAGVGELFSGHLAVKTYNALTWRPGALPPRQWEVKNYLARSKQQKMKMTAVTSGGDFAHTDFKLLETTPGGLWVEAKPRTGRTHQIRVHLSEAGLFILGDATYGNPVTAKAAPRLMLHAVNLTFPHPITRALTSVNSPVPADFNQCLQRLRAPGAT